MTIHWAHVDENGYMVTWGTSQGTDVFLQTLQAGLIAVSRPEEANGLDGWRLVNNQWVQEAPEQAT